MYRERGLREREAEGRERGRGQRGERERERERVDKKSQVKANKCAENICIDF